MNHSNELFLTTYALVCGVQNAIGNALCIIWPTTDENCPKKRKKQKYDQIFIA